MTQRRNILLQSPVVAICRKCGRALEHVPLRFRNAMKGLLRVALVLVLSAGSYLLFSRFCFGTVEILGQSMAPNLSSGERFFLDRLSLLTHAPQRGDLVVLREPLHGDYVIKRIVGMPGEQFAMRKNIAYVGGSRLVEPYLPAAAVATEKAMLEAAVRIPSESYYVLGDNRDNSEDSRCYGPVRRKSIVGVVHLGKQPRAFVRVASASERVQARSLPLSGISAQALQRASNATVSSN
jgi:signal peptidase I